MILSIYLSVIIILSVISMLTAAYSKKYKEILEDNNYTVIGLLIVMWPLVTAIILVIGLSVIVIIPSKFVS